MAASLRPSSLAFFPKYPGSGVHAVGAGSEISRVQISQEDVFFLELAFQPDCKKRFLDLSAESPFRGKKHQACKLLCYGTSALPRTASLRIPPAGPQYSPKIDAVVLAEPSIFDRDNRLGQMRRQIRSRQLVSFEYAAGGENVALGTFERQSALGGFDLKATSEGQRRNAVQDKYNKKRQPKRERRKILRTKFYRRQAPAPFLPRRRAILPSFEMRFQIEIWPASVCCP